MDTKASSITTSNPLVIYRATLLSLLPIKNNTPHAWLSGTWRISFSQRHIWTAKSAALPNSKISPGPHGTEEDDISTDTPYMFFLLWRHFMIIHAKWKIGYGKWNEMRWNEMNEMYRYIYINGMELNEMKSHLMAVPPIAIAPLWISPPRWISWPRRQSYKTHPARHWDPRRGLCPLWPRPPDLGWFWILDAIYLGTQSWTTDLKKRHGRWYAHNSWILNGFEAMP